MDCRDCRDRRDRWDCWDCWERRGISPYLGGNWWNLVIFHKNDHFCTFGGFRSQPLWKQRPNRLQMGTAGSKIGHFHGNPWKWVKNDEKGWKSVIFHENLDFCNSWVHLRRNIQKRCKFHRHFASPGEAKARFYWNSMKMSLFRPFSWNSTFLVKFHEIHSFYSPGTTFHLIWHLFS